MEQPPPPLQKKMPSMLSYTPVTFLITPKGQWCEVIKLLYLTLNILSVSMVASYFSILFFFILIFERPAGKNDLGGS